MKQEFKRDRNTEASWAQKKANHFTLLQLLALGMLWGWAQNTLASDVIIQGVPQVEIPSCGVTAGPPVADYGIRSRGQLQEAGKGTLSFGKRIINVNAACTLSKELRLRVDGPMRENQFSWGGADSVLRVHARQAQLDGNAVQLQLLNAAGNRNGEPADMVEVRPGDILTVMNGGREDPGRQLNLALEIEGVAGLRDGRPVRQQEQETALTVSLVP